MKKLKIRALYRKRINSKGKLLKVKTLHFGYGDTLIEAECYWEEDGKIKTEWISGAKLEIVTKPFSSKPDKGRSCP